MACSTLCLKAAWTARCSLTISTARSSTLVVVVSSFIADPLTAPATFPWHNAEEVILADRSSRARLATRRRQRY